MPSYRDLANRIGFILSGQFFEASFPFPLMSFIFTDSLVAFQNEVRQQESLLVLLSFYKKN